MNYRIKLTWNGSTVLEGRCTSVVASDVATAFLRDQFVPVGDGRGRMAEAVAMLALDHILSRSFTRAGFADATGEATVEIESEVTSEGGPK